MLPTRNIKSLKIGWENNQCPWQQFYDGLIDEEKNWLRLFKIYFLGQMNNCADYQ
jgi:hypothetical protein